MDDLRELAREQSKSLGGPYFVLIDYDGHPLVFAQDTESLELQCEDELDLDRVEVWQEGGRVEDYFERIERHVDEHLAWLLHAKEP